MTTNPKVVESRFKAYLKVHNRLVKCKTPKKKYNDTEVFAATSQEDYAQLALQAKRIADEYEREILGDYKMQALP